MDKISCLLISLFVFQSIAILAETNFFDTLCIRHIEMENLTIEDAILNLKKNIGNHEQTDFQFLVETKSTNRISLLADNIKLTDIINTICDITKTHMIQMTNREYQTIVKITDIPPPVCVYEWTIPFSALCDVMNLSKEELVKRLKLIQKHGKYGNKIKISEENEMIIIKSPTSEDNEVFLLEIVNELKKNYLVDYNHISMCGKYLTSPIMSSIFIAFPKKIIEEKCSDS